MSVLIKYFVTWFGAGLAPKAPGTMGSLAALPFVYVAHVCDAMVWLAGATIIAFAAGIWASDRYMADTGNVDDPKEIVIDEVAGQWLVFVAMPLMWLPASNDMLVQLLVAGFLAFRLFDIAKPWPVSWADRRIKGGLGVMLDDILAALLAVVSLGIVGHLAMAILETSYD